MGVFWTKGLHILNITRFLEIKSVEISAGFYISQEGREFRAKEPHFSRISHVATVLRTTTSKVFDVCNYWDNTETK